jgi:hypothetical protein
MLLNNLLPSDVFPLAVGRKWSYTVGTGLLFRKSGDVTVKDKKNNYYVIKINSGKLDVSAVVKCDVDMSIVAYSSTGVELLEDESAFEAVPKVEILKSPIISGTKWQNSMGSFGIVNTSYTLKLDKKSYPECVFLQLRDTSNQLNEFYIRKGVGLVYGSIYIDGVGKVHVNLTKFS